MIVWYASKAHYAHHLQHHLAFHDGETVRLDSPADRPGWTAPIMVAARKDADRLAGRPVILVEHGIGQSYLVTDRHGVTSRYDAGNAPPSDNVVEHWAPNPIALDAMRHRDVLPNADGLVVGAPHLWWLAELRGELKRRRSMPNIAVACHWSSPIDAPEARGAWPWITLALNLLRHVPIEATITLVPHPLIGGQMRRHPFARVPGVVVEPHWPTVLAMSDVVVADNTSMLWEAAALDVPTVAVWPPHWRNRKLVPQHGIRFPGPRFIPHPRDCDEPADIATALHRVLDLWRRDAVDQRTRDLGAEVRATLYPDVDDTPALVTPHLQRVDTYARR